jgi:predicted Zn-dependent peptidase
MTPVDRTRLPAVGPSLPVRFPDVHKDRLDNHVALWSAPHRGLPVVTFMLLFPFGSAADFEGYEGLAALTADMLDEGTGDRSAVEVNAEFGRLGTHLDTDVGADATVLALTCLTRYAPRALSLMAELVVRPRLAEADFERLRSLRLSRLIQIRDVPSAIADRAFMQLVYGAHPYAHMALGTEEALRQITLEDVRAFHRRNYAPASATLVAAGEIDGASLRAFAQEAFRDWHADDHQTLPDPALVPPPAAPAHRLALVNKAGAAQSEIRIGGVGLTRNTPDYHPLIVLNMVLGGQFVSRINMKLRQEKGLTYGARSGFDFRRGRGPFILQTSVQTDRTADAVNEALAELQAIASDRPPTGDELETAKAALTKGYARNFETSDQIARAITQLVLYGLSDDYFDTFAAKVSKVDIEQATRVARAHLDVTKLTTAVVADATLVGPQLTASGVGEAVPLLPRL